MNTNQITLSIVAVLAGVSALGLMYWLWQNSK